MLNTVISSRTLPGNPPVNRKSLCLASGEWGTTMLSVSEILVRARLRSTGSAHFSEDVRQHRELASFSIELSLWCDHVESEPAHYEHLHTDMSASDPTMALAYHTGLDRELSRSSRATRAYRKHMTHVHYGCRDGGLAAALPNTAASDWFTWKSYPEHVSCTSLHCAIRRATTKRPRMEIRTYIRTYHEQRTYVHATRFAKNDMALSLRASA